MSLQAEDVLKRIAHLPNEVLKGLQEIKEKDYASAELLSQNEEIYQERLSTLSSDLQNLTADGILRMDENFNSSIEVASQKVKIADRMYDLVDAQCTILDNMLRKIEEEKKEKILYAGAIAGDSMIFNQLRTPLEVNSTLGKRSHEGQLQAPSQRAEHSELEMDLPIDPSEPTYCICNRVSFGEMIQCDNDLCKTEWFHFECVGIVSQPKGKWYCPDCRAAMPKKNSKNKKRGR